MAISLLMLFPCRLHLHVSAYFWWLWSCYVLIIGMTFLSRIQMWHCTFSSGVPVSLTCSVCLYLHFFLEEVADFEFLSVCLFVILKWNSCAFVTFSVLLKYFSIIIQLLSPVLFSKNFILFSLDYFSQPRGMKHFKSWNGILSDIRLFHFQVWYRIATDNWFSYCSHLLNQYLLVSQMQISKIKFHMFLKAGYHNTI